MKKHFEIILPGYMPAVLFAPAGVSFCGKKVVDYVFPCSFQNSHFEYRACDNKPKQPDVLLAPSLALTT